MLDNPKKLPARIDKLIAHCRQLDNQLDELKAGYKAKTIPIDNLRKEIEGELLRILDAAGVKTARTAEGTATAEEKITASCSDPDVFMDYVKRTGRFELLNRAANPTACREFTEKNQEPPPGVKLNFLRYVQIRKPS